MVMTLTRPAGMREDQNSLRFRSKGPTRRPLLAVGSLVLVIASSAAFTSLYARAGGRVDVLAVARPIKAGRTIQPQDLTIVHVSLAPALSVVDGSDVARIVGRRAAVPLVPGTLLSPRDLATGPAVAPGDAVVGVATKPGQLPADGVQPGDTVAVLETSSPGLAQADLSPTGTAEPDAAGALTGAGNVLAPVATVTGVSTTASSDGTAVVSVLVPRSLAPAIASASTAGQAALVLVNEGS